MNMDDEGTGPKHCGKYRFQQRPALGKYCDGIKYVLASHHMTGRTLHPDGGRHLKKLVSLCWLLAVK
ncbi:hypothetical protein OK016_00745 [Vibrio chagasii]|nr:hypothetical protein [Vibrio chagasii]